MGDPTAKEESDDSSEWASLRPIFAHMLEDPECWAKTVADMTRHYYCSMCWDANLYATLCYRGFVTVAQEPVWLVPELQKAYAVLDFDNIHIERNVKKRIRKQRYKLAVDYKSEVVFESICKHHKNNWLQSRYWGMLKEAKKGLVVCQDGTQFSMFVPHTFALVDKDTEEVVAGEIGYTVGTTYTSLTGFYDTAHPSAGKIQLIAMARFLQQRGIAFVNLGHIPSGKSMKYKTEIGAHNLHRFDFLKRWEAAHNGLVQLEGEVDVTVDYVSTQPQVIPSILPSRAG